MRFTPTSTLLSRAASGRQEVVLRITAKTLRQAVTTALAVVGKAGHQAFAIEALPTLEFDRRPGLEPIPELLSVAEAASVLGVSRQAVQQRIDSGTLAAQRVGKAWVVARSEVTSKTPR